jgi:hypothetical protein
VQRRARGGQRRGGVDAGSREPYALRSIYGFIFCRGGRATTSVTVCVTEQRLATAEAELHKRDQTIRALEMQLHRASVPSKLPQPTPSGSQQQQQQHLQ